MQSKAFQQVMWPLFLHLMILISTLLWLVFRLPPLPPHSSLALIYLLLTTISTTFGFVVAWHARDDNKANSENISSSSIISGSCSQTWSTRRYRGSLLTHPTTYNAFHHSPSCHCALQTKQNIMQVHKRFDPIYVDAVNRIRGLGLHHILYEFVCSIQTLCQVEWWCGA